MMMYNFKSKVEMFGGQPEKKYQFPYSADTLQAVQVFPNDTSFIIHKYFLRHVLLNQIYKKFCDKTKTAQIPEFIFRNKIINKQVLAIIFTILHAASLTQAFIRL